MQRIENVFINDKIFDFACAMAFRDATMRKAFPKRDGEKQTRRGDEIFRDRKNRVKGCARDDVKAYFDALLDESSPRPNPVETIIIVYNKTKDDGFTFGNAQKLVNMTAKYMYLNAYGDENKNKLFETCHCPMDGIMIDAMKRIFTEEKWSFSWSALESDGKNPPNEYTQFQKCVKVIAEKERIIPLEVDFLFWDE